MSKHSFAIPLITLAAVNCCAACAQNTSIDAQMDAAKAAFNNGSISNGPPLFAMKQAESFERQANTRFHEDRRLDEAESLYKRALEIREKYLGPKDALVAVTLDELAELYAWQNKYKDAETTANRALEIWKGVVPPISIDGVDNPKHVVMTLNNIGVYFMNANKYAEAEKVLSEAIRLDPKYELAYANRAIAREKRGDKKGAVEDRAKGP